MLHAKDIFGTYLLQYYDKDGNVCQSTFDVTADNANAIDMPIYFGGRIPWHTPFEKQQTRPHHFH